MDNAVKHYNGASVWGVVEKFKRDKTEAGKPFVAVFVNCPHDLYGNVRILGRIWGLEAVSQFMDKYKRGDELRLEGGIQQYDGRNNVRKTSFNFYRILPGPLKEKKAAFRLTGETVSMENGELRVLIRQEVKGDFEDKENEFVVYVPQDVLLGVNNDPAPGDLVQVKGYIVGAEDEFGEMSNTQRPEVKVLEVLSVPEVPF